MSRLKRLIQEIHRGSLWQVLGIYLGGAWVALQGIEALVSVLGLPEWVPGFALVVTQNGNAGTYDISTPQAVAASTGWNLPVKALPYWVRGLPAPAPAPSDTRIDAGLMQRFEQGGWQVQYERYQEKCTRRLPVIILERPE